MVYAPDEVPQDPEAALIRRIEELERRLDQLGGADVLRTAGIRAEAARLIVQGALQVTGDTLIEGTLTLPAGIIGNDALANPTKPGAATAGSGTVSVATSSTETDYATVTIPVPAGFTTAAVIGVSAARYNVAAQRIATVISGDVGSFQSGNDTLGNITSSHTAILTGLSGGNVTVSSRIATNGPAGNAYPLTSALVTFYR